jgi:hypothetical protein
MAPSPPPKCSSCNKNITQIKRPGLNCVKCQKYFHRDCANIKKEKFEHIASEGLSWTCSKCDKKRTSIFPLDLNSTCRAPTNNTAASPSPDFAKFKEDTDRRISALELLVKVQSEEIKTLKESVGQVHNKAIELEKVSVDSDLEIQGIPETTLSDPNIAVNIVAEQINCKVQAEEVHCSVIKSGTKQVLRVNFASKSKRESFLSAGKRFNREKRLLIVKQQRHKIFVNERLTPEQKTLLYNTKVFAKLNNFYCAWICNNLVHLKLSHDSLPTVIRSQAQLDLIKGNGSHRVLSERERFEHEDSRRLSQSSEQ